MGFSDLGCFGDKDYPTFSPLSQYPTSRGFDRYFGTIWGVVDYYDPFALVSGTTPIKKVPPGYYHTDAINDTAVAYIKAFAGVGDKGIGGSGDKGIGRSRDKGIGGSRDKGIGRSGDKGFAGSREPFFLYVAENAPHWPLMALPEDIAKYRDTYKAGWDAIREARYQRMVKMGLIDSSTTRLSPRWNDKLSWENNPDKDWDAMAMAVHAAMIDRMDQGIGRIIEALKATGQLDNTLIVVLSDNGASAENAAAYGPGFDRPSQTRDGRNIVYATKKEALPGTETTYSSIGQRWANVANTPYRLWKAESYEGGVHTPMIAFWPKGIAAARGSYSDRVGHVMDFMRTFVEVSGAVYPTTYKGRAIPPTPGISLVPSFRGDGVDRRGGRDLRGMGSKGHEELFNEHFGARYAREGDWKIVAEGGDSVWRLFNMGLDKSETVDVASSRPDVVTRLDSLWRQWANTHDVFPKPRKGR